MSLIFSRRILAALSMSPPASVRAALQAIMGALVRFRNSLTALALIVLMLLRPLSGTPLAAWHTLPGRQRRSLGIAFYDCTTGAAGFGFGGATGALGPLLAAAAG